MNLQPKGAVTMTEKTGETDLTVKERLCRDLKKVYDQTPYFKSMPCTVEDLDPGRVRVGFDISRHACNYRGIASGGVLAAFCDTLMGMACRTLGLQITTLEINMNYIRSVKGGEHITGIGQVIHYGRKTLVVGCECYDAAGRIIVKGRSSFYILKKIDE